MGERKFPVVAQRPVVCHVGSPLYRTKDAAFTTVYGLWDPVGELRHFCIDEASYSPEDHSFNLYDGMPGGWCAKELRDREDHPYFLTCASPGRHTLYLHAKTTEGRKSSVSRHEVILTDELLSAPTVEPKTQRIHKGWPLSFQWTPSGSSCTPTSTSTDTVEETKETKADESFETPSGISGGERVTFQVCDMLWAAEDKPPQLPKDALIDNNEWSGDTQSWSVSEHWKDVADPAAHYLKPSGVLKRRVWVRASSPYRRSAISEPVDFVVQRVVVT